MNEPMYPDLPPKPTALEKLLLFMVAGLMVAVLILGIRVGNQGNKIEQLQGGSSDAPTDTSTVATHSHNYAPYTHEHAKETSPFIGSPYAERTHTHDTGCFAGGTGTVIGGGGTVGTWTGDNYHTHYLDC